MGEERTQRRYLNWRALIETDYIAMFIKTWFTFLATLQELVYIDTSSRDSKILREYKNMLFEEVEVHMDDEFMKNVLRSYIQAKNRVLNLNEFKEHYFQIFYSYNERYSQCFEYEYKGRITKLCLRVFPNKSEKHLKITLSDERKEFIRYFGEVIETGFSLSEAISDRRIFQDKDVFIGEVLSSIMQKAENIVNNNYRLDDMGRKKRMIFLKKKCLLDIKTKLRHELDIREVFPLKPHNKISTLNPNTLEIREKPQFFEEDLTRWFVDFAYKLRNILFHSIIDPLDENWQLLFKHSYRALRHLTEENIRFLQNNKGRGD